MQIMLIFFTSKASKKIKILKMVVQKKKSDPLIYVLASCLTPSLHQVIDTCVRFFYLIVFIGLSISDLV